MLKVPHYKIAVVFIWLAFLIRGCFYIAVLPLWEGYDEYAHFAYVERLVTSGRLLIDRNQPVPPDVANSLQVAPLPWELRSSPPPALAEDAFWKLPPSERASRVKRLRSIRAGAAPEQSSGNQTIYEGLQAPLYYWIASPVYAAMRNATLLDRVLALRAFSLLIASALIPLAFLAARQSISNDRAIGIIAAVALLPELFFDVARVGNECLGIVMFTLLLFLCGKTPNCQRLAVWIGLTLGLGLLTKAYFLTAIPAVLLLARPWKSALHLKRALISLAVAALISSWWYVNNKQTTGSWTGLNEALMIGGATTADLFRAVRRVDWRNAIDSILLSHIWFGGWSSLQVRGWIYHLYMALSAAGAVGIAAMMMRTRRTQLLSPVMFYSWFWLGQVYNVLLLFLSKGASTSMGWYLYAVVAAEIILLVRGLTYLVPKTTKALVIPLLAASFAALDLYTIQFVAIPYYAGITAHRPNNGVANLHLAQIASFSCQELAARLAATKPEWVTPAVYGTLWMAYISVTLALLALSIKQVAGPASTNSG